MLLIFSKETVNYFSLSEITVWQFLTVKSGERFSITLMEQEWKTKLPVSHKYCSCRFPQFLNSQHMHVLECLCVADCHQQFLLSLLLPSSSQLRCTSKPLPWQKCECVQSRICPPFLGGGGGLVFCNHSWMMSVNHTHCHATNYFDADHHFPLGARGSVVVKALCYKPDGRGFDSRWGEFLNLPNPSGRTRPWGLLSL
jgi:hypothetical protein